MTAPTTGLVVLSDEKWYGPGYCGICGDRGEDLVTRAVRWWDPDDGWKMGVLCNECTNEAVETPPKPGDFAYDDNYGGEAADYPTTDMVIDILSDDDLDAGYSWQKGGA